MNDLAALVGFKQLSNSSCKFSANKVYYLQQLGIDIWQWRQSPKRVLLLVARNYGQQQTSKLAHILLENMLASSLIKRTDFELSYISSVADLENINIDTYACVVLMIDDVNLNDKVIERIEVPVIKMQHPSYLLANPLAKKSAYLELCKLEV